MIDIHCHILPGVDDGPKTLEESLEMARIAVLDGISAIVATPHVINGVYNNTRLQILEKVSKLNDELSLHNIDLRVLPGGEYHLEWQLPRLLEKEEVVTLNDAGRYLLVELPVLEVPQYTEDILFEVTLAGMVPIIVHPERNAQLAQEPDLLYDILEKGALSQITGASLCGKFGNSAAEVARYFVERGWVHFLASDAHSPEARKPVLSKARRVLVDLAGDEAARLLLLDNPSQAVQGKAVAAGNYKRPSRVKKKKGFFNKLFPR